MTRTTIFGSVRFHRYTLWRQWDMINSSYLQVIGLNPSTADEVQDDPTIRRCIDFAKRWGFGALCMTNLFAWRATDPKALKKLTNPIGELNDQYLLEASVEAGMILAAWGKHGRHMGRDRDVMDLIPRRLHCLGTNADGTPKHPLYLRGTIQPWLL